MKMQVRGPVSLKTLPTHLTSTAFPKASSMKTVGKWGSHVATWWLGHKHTSRSRSHHVLTVGVGFRMTDCVTPTFSFTGTARASWVESRGLHGSLHQQSPSLGLWCFLEISVWPSSRDKVGKKSVEEKMCSGWDLSVTADSPRRAGLKCSAEAKLSFPQ